MHAHIVAAEAERIDGYARFLTAGLVVMATHARHGLERTLLGSEADAVFRGD